MPLFALPFSKHWASKTLENLESEGQFLRAKVEDIRADIPARN